MSENELPSSRVAKRSRRTSLGIAIFSTALALAVAGEGAIAWRAHLAVVALDEALKRTQAELAGNEQQIQALNTELGALNKTLNEARYEIYTLKPGNVDLTVATLQLVDSRFLLGNASVEPHLNGLKVKGRVVNATSLGQEAVKFRMTIGSAQQDITIMRIPSGGSGSFETFVPNAIASDLRFATFEYLESVTHYY